MKISQTFFWVTERTRYCDRQTDGWTDDPGKNNVSPNTKVGGHEPSHEIMVLFVLRKLILQMGTRSHPVGLDVLDVLDVWFLVGPFVFFHTSCVWTAKALARLRGCTGSLEPSLVAYVVSTIISWAGSNNSGKCILRGKFQDISS